MSQVVYSAQKSGFVKGRIYLNPRFFDGTLQPGVTSVVIVGDWPKVEEAYKAAGIPVTIAKNANSLPNPDAGTDNVSREVTTEHQDSVVKGKGKDAGKIDPPLKDGSNVELPENYEELPFKQLKLLAAKLTKGKTPDFSSKAQVVEYLEQFKPAGDD